MSWTSLKYESPQLRIHIAHSSYKESAIKAVHDRFETKLESETEGEVLYLNPGGLIDITMEPSVHDFPVYGKVSVRPEHVLLVMDAFSRSVDLGNDLVALILSERFTLVLTTDCYKQISGWLITLLPQGQVALADIQEKLFGWIAAPLTQAETGAESSDNLNEN